jgi:taurine dioxygenase
MVIERRRLSPEIGVELAGFEPSRLDDAATEAFRSAFRDHRLVLLRDVELSEAAGVALSETLGPVSFKSPFMQKGGARKFSYVSNQHVDGTLRDGELLFHADHSFLPWPLKAISLYAMQTPRSGGETMFTDAAGAYARLPEGLKTRIEGLTGRPSPANWL